MITHYPFPPPGEAPLVERAPYPAPSLISSDPLPQPASGPASGLLSLAVLHGWDGIITMAEGCLPHATHGRPNAAKFSEAVRLVRGTQRAVAVRMGGSWSSLWTWSDEVFFTRYATLGAFEQAITQPVDNPVDNALTTTEAPNASAEA